MATAFSDWCDQLKSEKWSNNSEFDILESYVTEAITATEAAARLTAYSDRSQTANSKIGRIWTMLLLCADECSDTHDALIELIRALVVVPPSKDTGSVDWSDQETSFKELWRDSYDSLHASLQDGTNYQRDSAVPLRQKWINFHSFSAKLADTGIFGVDFGLVSGLDVIVAALEKKAPTSSDLEVNAPAAAHWLLHSARTIFRDGTEMGTNWGAESELWQGKEGFSRQRWNLWKDSLEQISSNIQLQDETKQLARKAIVSMGKTERAKK